MTLLNEKGYYKDYDKIIHAQIHDLRARIYVQQMKIEAYMESMPDDWFEKVEKCTRLINAYRHKLEALQFRLQSKYSKPPHEKYKI